MKPQDSLRQSADVFEERGRVYGEAYKRFGPVMEALFPGGFYAFGPDAFNRLGVIVQIVSKLVRYTGAMKDGGHDDSLLDLSTYAAMLRELDAEGRNPKSDGSFHDRVSFNAPPQFDPKPGCPAWEAEMEIEPVVSRREPPQGYPGETVKEMRERLGMDRVVRDRSSPISPGR